MQQAEPKSKFIRVLKEGLDPASIQCNLEVEHLCDTTPSTLHRLFSSVTKQLAHATVQMLVTEKPNLMPESYETTKKGLMVAIETVVPFTAGLKEPGAELPFNDPTFMLGICNVIVTSVTLLEYQQDQKEKAALVEMLDSIATNMAQKQATAEANDRVDAAAFILADSPEDAMEQLRQLQQRTEDAAKAKGEPPVH